MQGTGVQATSSANATLAIKFPNAVNAGDLIAIALAWSSGSSTAVPTVADNKNSGNYTYEGPSTISGSTVNVGIWYYPASVAVAANTLVVTATTTSGAYLAMAGDEFTYVGGLSVDRTNQTSQTSATSISTALTVTGSPDVDMIYAATSNTGSATGAVSAGSGFTASYNQQTISGQANGIMAEYAYPVTSNTSATASSAGADLGYISAVAFRLTPPLMINWAAADTFISSALPAGITPITFSNVTVGQKIRITLTQGTGGQTVVWPSGISGNPWPPTLSTGAGLRDQLCVECVATNTYYGYVILQGF